MANETMVQSSHSEENAEADECCENIPPGVTVAAETSKLKAQPSAENKPVTFTFSTPACSSGGINTKSRLSGLQSALTPILKYLNIGNKCTSPEPLKHGNNPHLNVPSTSFGVTKANNQKSGGSSQHPNPSSHFGRSLGDNDSPVCWLKDECLPEITLLDVTCDSTMQLTRNDSLVPDSLPATPVTARSLNSTFSVDKPSPPDVCDTLSCTKENNSELNPPGPPKQNGTTLHESRMFDTPKSVNTSARWLGDIYFQEITLLDVTRDAEQSPGLDMSSAEVKQDVPPADSVKNRRPSSELGGQVPEPAKTDEVPGEETSSTLTGSVTHTTSSLSEPSVKCVEENSMKASLEATQDISMGSVLENSRSLLEQNAVKSQASAEDTLGTHPANVTRDISSSSDMSVQCAASQLSSSDMPGNISSNVTYEVHDKPKETSNAVETSHDAELTGKGSQLTPKTSGAANGTFSIAQSSGLSATTVLNTTAQISSPQNKTLDFPPSNVSCPRAESEATTEQVTAVCKNTETLNTETSHGTTRDCSSLKADGTCDMQNATFDRHSLQRSTDSTNLEEARAATFCIQNNTFDSKPPSKQNGTITLSETSASDSHRNGLEQPTPPKVCDPTTSPKDNNSEAHPPVLSKQNGTITNTDVVMVDTTESTSEANPAAEGASGASAHETKDQSQSGGLSDSLDPQGMDTENNKTNTFNLDDTLDLKVDALVTSTPMTNCKAFHFSTEREEGKILGAQKKLYGDGPSKPAGPAPSDVPSNIVSYRKTFLTQPAAKSLLPHSRAGSMLLKFKPASLLPGKCEPPTSGLPMTRQRTKNEALKNSAAPDAPQATAGIPASYNLRATTTGTKQPHSGLAKPQQSGIPSGIQRSTSGLRPPTGRSNAPASSTAAKLRLPTGSQNATNPAPKTSQAQKHPLPKAEALPTAKRKKTDAPLPSSNAEASTSSCDAVTRANNLKQPTTSQRALTAKTQRDDAAVLASVAETSTSCDATSRARALKQPANSHSHRVLPKLQGHGCAKCIALEEQLKIKSEEIRKLKEELLKYSKEGRDC